MDFFDRKGGRFSGGYWLDDEQTWGLDAGYFFMAGRAINHSFVSPGNPVLANPFLNVNTGVPDASLVTFPGVMSGQIAVDAPSFLQGAEANLSAVFWRGEHFRLEALAGFRYLNLSEGLHIEETSLVTLAPQFVGLVPFDGNTIALSDRFDAHNHFYGGQVGVRAELQYKRFTLGVLGKVALGVSHEVVSIRGSTSIDTQPATFSNGGLYAVSSNSGQFTRNVFAVVPEVGSQPRFPTYRQSARLRRVHVPVLEQRRPPGRSGGYQRQLEPGAEQHDVRRRRRAHAAGVWVSQHGFFCSWRELRVGVSLLSGLWQPVRETASGVPIQGWNPHETLCRATRGPDDAGVYRQSVAARAAATVDADGGAGANLAATGRRGDRERRRHHRGRRSQRHDPRRARRGTRGAGHHRQRQHARFCHRRRRRQGAHRRPSSRRTPRPLTSRTVQFISQSTITAARGQFVHVHLRPQFDHRRARLRRSHRHRRALPAQHPQHAAGRSVRHRAHQSRHARQPRPEPAASSFTPCGGGFGGERWSPCQPVQHRPAFVPAGKALWRRSPTSIRC